MPGPGLQRWLCWGCGDKPPPSEETFQQSNGNQNTPIPKKSSFCPAVLCTPALLLPRNTRRSSCESKWGNSWGEGAEITEPGTSQRCQCQDRKKWPQTETLEMPLQTRKTLFWGWLDTRTIVLAHCPGQPPVLLLVEQGWDGTIPEVPARMWLSPKPCSCMSGRPGKCCVSTEMLFQRVKHNSWLQNNGLVTLKPNVQ